MDKEQVWRLTGQAQLGEEAEMALRCCERLFPAMREEIYRQMEGGGGAGSGAAAGEAGGAAECGGKAGGVYPRRAAGAEGAGG